MTVERAVAIVTQITLKYAIAAVPNHRFAMVAWPIDAITPVNLLVQVRSATLQNERLDREHRSSGDATCHACLL